MTIRNNGETPELSLREGDIGDLFLTDYHYARHLTDSHGYSPEQVYAKPGQPFPWAHLDALHANARITGLDLTPEAKLEADLRRRHGVTEPSMRDQTTAQPATPLRPETSGQDAIVRLAAWFLLPTTAAIIQLRKAHTTPSWRGYLLFMAAYNATGMAYRAYEMTRAHGTLKRSLRG